MYYLKEIQGPLNQPGKQRCTMGNWIFVPILSWNAYENKCASSLAGHMSQRSQRTIHFQTGIYIYIYIYFQTGIYRLSMRWLKCIQLGEIIMQETSWPGQKRVLLGALLARWVLDSIGAEIFDKNPIKISDWDQIIVFLSDVWYDPKGSVHIHAHQVLWKASMAVTTVWQVVPPSLGSGAAFSGSQSFVHLWRMNCATIIFIRGWLSLCQTFQVNHQ